MRNRLISRLFCALLLGTLLLTNQSAEPANAQNVRRCFSETGYCISGRIREYWEQNGGLPVFGLPISPLQYETIEGKRILVQWFERNRLELHRGNPKPYDVLLGRLGAEQYAKQVGDWRQQPANTSYDSTCLRFAETPHAICGDILKMWRSNGLRLDNNAAISQDESLALFGLPLSSLRTETHNGKQISVQWFERGRFELHPENQPPYNVLLGLLGNESKPIIGSEVADPTITTQPTRINIPSINSDTRIISVGMDSRGELVVPDHDVGWYKYSAKIGAGDNIVLWGHVLRFRSSPNTPAPFERLKETAIGTEIQLTDELGRVHTYRITQHIEANPTDVKYILPTGREMLTIVSCYGDSVISNGQVVDMTKRLITIAEPVN